MSQGQKKSPRMDENKTAGQKKIATDHDDEEMGASDMPHRHDATQSNPIQFMDVFTLLRTNLEERALQTPDEGFKDDCETWGGLNEIETRQFRVSFLPSFLETLHELNESGKLSTKTFHNIKPCLLAGAFKGVKSSQRQILNTCVNLFLHALKAKSSAIDNERNKSLANAYFILMQQKKIASLERQNKSNSGGDGIVGEMNRNLMQENKLLTEGKEYLLAKIASLEETVLSLTSQMSERTVRLGEQEDANEAMARRDRAHQTHDTSKLI
jgi:hypothetical protein